MTKHTDIPCICNGIIDRLEFAWRDGRAALLLLDIKTHDTNVHRVRHPRIVPLAIDKLLL